ncbi:MAG: hypothetical protein AB1609_20315 [Bacillota bacterium]
MRDGAWKTAAVVVIHASLAFWVGLYGPGLTMLALCAWLLWSRVLRNRPFWGTGPLALVDGWWLRRYLRSQGLRGGTYVLLLVPRVAQGKAAWLACRAVRRSDLVWVTPGKVHVYFPSVTDYFGAKELARRLEAVLAGAGIPVLAGSGGSIAWSGADLADTLFGPPPARVFGRATA